MTGEDDEACRASPIESAITNDDASRPIQSRKRNWDQLVAVDRAAAIIEETMRQKPNAQQPLHLLLSSRNPKSIDDAKRLAENLMDTISVESEASRFIFQSVTLQPVAGGTSYSGYAGIYPRSHSTATSCSSP
ncbi:hypothetical protein DY000_02011076 [Brassica cretica]|uniref:Uncharacterized protein n=1 Tax=Brassica cretica TaxID=69181 RepID=A0ABQ7DCW1_BRACR|nr:hypothetical protein DY000_02011076 [Brassica cretica]